MNETSEFGRRLKFLRERDQITITRLSQLTHYDKDRLRDFEAGRAEPKDWELQTIAETFKVKIEYFGSTALPAGAPDPKGAALDGTQDGESAPTPPQPGMGPAAGAKRTAAPRKEMDFSGTAWFKEGDKPGPKPAPRRAPEPEPEALPSDLFDDSSAIPPMASRAPLVDTATSAPPPRPKPVDAPRPKPADAPPPKPRAPEPPQKPRAPEPAPKPRAAEPPRAPEQPAPRRTAEEPPSLFDARAALAPGEMTPPNANDARFAAVEALVYVKALCEVLLQRGNFGVEEFARALRRARGED